jgi:hypothetical protein
MRLLLILIFFTGCQLKYSHTLPPYLDNTFILRDVQGSWQLENSDLFITFYQNHEFIASKYINNRFQSGHEIIFSGNYHVRKDTIIITTCENCVISKIFFYSFYKTASIQSVQYEAGFPWSGTWVNVPTIFDFELYPKPLRPLPVVINPRPPSSGNPDNSTQNSSQIEHNPRPEAQRSLKTIKENNEESGKKKANV